MFPKGKRGTPPQSKEELMTSLEETKREHIDILVDQMLEIIFQITYQEGFDLTNDDNIESTVFMSEAIKAALLDSVGLDHPFLDIAYDVVETEVATQAVENVESE